MEVNIWKIAAAGLLVLAACVEPEPRHVGAPFYDANCAICHGPVGKGDGVLAPELTTAPADLTRLAERNGGVFPRVRVMSQIDGYARDGRGPMPAFGGGLEGEVVMYDAGDGVLTPTPIQLVELADYIESLQQ